MGFQGFSEDGPQGLRIPRRTKPILRQTKNTVTHLRPRYSEARLKAFLFAEEPIFGPVLPKQEIIEERGKRPKAAR